jgi:fused signal recognition particle receptor
MDELAKVARIAARVIPEAPHETLLVLDATVGGNGLRQAREFTSALKVTGIVLAKMDGTARGGIVVAVAKELGIPVRYVGVGEGASDLLPFSPEAFVDALVSE